MCGSFWGVEKIQNGGRCHGNQGAKNVKFTQRILLKLDTKIDHHSKLCSLFLKFSKWPPIEKLKKIVKNSKMKRFQWKWIFTGSKTCCNILRPFSVRYDSKITAKIQKSSDLSEIWFPSRLSYDVANWYPNFTGMLSIMSRCADYFWNFQNGRRCHGNHKKKHEKFKVLGIGWNFPEILSDTCTHNFEA